MDINPQILALHRLQKEDRRLASIERKLANRFLSQNVDTPENNRVIFLQTLLISNEFTYID